MNDRGRAYRRLRIYGDTHPNYSAGFLHTDDRVGKNVTMCDRAVARG